MYRNQVVRELQSFDAYLETLVEDKAETLPGVADDTEVRFALDELRRARIDAARQFFRGDEVDQLDQFARFMRGLRAMARRRVELAEDPDAVADALTNALDDLHRYLLAHDLVGASYRPAQEIEPNTAPAWLHSRHGRVRVGPHAGSWKNSPVSSDEDVDAHEFALNA